jgi:hypothetical protein
MTIGHIGPAGIPALGLGTFKMNAGSCRETSDPNRVDANHAVDMYIELRA